MVMVIPEQHFVGYRDQGDGRLPLGFATPFGTDAAARKRMATVTSWSTPYRNSNQKAIEPKTINNELLSGFKLCEEVRRHSGWGNGNVVWRIEDPRGFELEISSPNFASIIDCTTIINGEIQGRCVWGRDGGSNVLLPESSAPYIEAAHLTKLSKQKVSNKDIRAGDKLRLKDGRDVLYLGAYTFMVYSEKHKYQGRGHGYGTTPSSSGYQHTHTIGAQRKRQMFVEWSKITTNSTIEDLLARTTKRYAHSQYKYIEGGPESASDMKVAEILERQAFPVDTATVCTFVNGLRAKFRNGYAGVDSVIAINTDTFGKTLAYELKEIDMSQVQDQRMYFTRNGLGKIHAVSVRDSSRSNSGHDLLIPIESALNELGVAGQSEADKYFNFRTSGLPAYNLILKTVRGDVVVDVPNIF